MRAWKKKLFDRHSYTPAGAPAAAPALVDANIVILVVGATGSGKGSFIHDAVGQLRGSAGKDLSPSSFAISEGSHPKNGQKVAFIDTPTLGFGEERAQFQAEAEQFVRDRSTHAKLSGILYLHSISKSLQQPIPEAHWHLLRRMSDNLLFVTTGWDPKEPNHEPHLRHEAECRRIAWVSALSKDQQIRYFRTYPWLVVDQLLKRQGSASHPLVVESRPESLARLQSQNAVDGIHPVSQETTRPGDRSIVTSMAPATALSPQLITCERLSIPVQANWLSMYDHWWWSSPPSALKETPNVAPPREVVPEPDEDAMTVVDDEGPMYDYHPGLRDTRALSGDWKYHSAIWSEKRTHMIESDTVIAVLGPKGVGKSTFIARATGGAYEVVGHETESCTTAVTAVRCPSPLDHIVLVDTPGLDDTSLTDTKILELIATWLEETYEKNFTLTGIIYMHRISDNRMVGNPLRNRTMVEKLCGKDAFKRLILATTMWDKVPEDVGVTQERDLAAAYRKTMLAVGSQIERFENTPESAWKIIKLLTRKHRQSVLRPLPGDRTNHSAIWGEQVTHIIQGDIIIASVYTFFGPLVAIDGEHSIMGPTGVGKSTFIAGATGGAYEGVGHELESCTTTVTAIRCPSPLDHIVLVDTPGFDDTNHPDTEILEMIATWLEETYKDDFKLTGIIYMHRISDNRMQGSPLKNLMMFEKLCGKDAFKSLILTTTMWDEVPEELGASREQELASKYWKPMLAVGSRIERFQNTPESARKIINILAGKHRQEILRLQQEMVDFHRRLSETEAGIGLSGSLKDLLKQQKTNLRQLEREMKEGNSDMVATLQDKRKRLQDDILATREQMGYLNIPLGDQFGLILAKATQGGPSFLRFGSQRA